MGMGEPVVEQPRLCPRPRIAPKSQPSKPYTKMCFGISIFDVLWGLVSKLARMHVFHHVLERVLFNNAGTIESSTKGTSKIDSQPDVARRSIIEEAEVKQCQAK